MLPHSNLHLVLAQVSQKASCCRMGCAGNSHGQGCHVIRKPLRYGSHLFQAFAFSGSRSRYLVGGDAANQAPPVICVGPWGIGNVLLGHYLDNVQSLLGALLHG